MHSKIITAILLVTLSWNTYATQCNEQEWNKALVSQQVLDRKYNVLAKKYNQWRPTFHQSIFLHREFSKQELDYLWRKNSDNFHLKVDKQILAAINSRQSVNELMENVSTLPELVNAQLSSWNQLKLACKKANFVPNQVAADHYIDSNKTLKRELSGLEQQLTKMREFYDREIQVLQKIEETSPIQSQ